MIVYINSRVIWKVICGWLWLLKRAITVTKCSLFVLYCWRILIKYSWVAPLKECIIAFVFLGSRFFVRNAQMTNPLERPGILLDLKSGVNIHLGNSMATHREQRIGWIFWIYIFKTIEKFSIKKQPSGAVMLMLDGSLRVWFVTGTLTERPKQDLKN